MNTSTKFIFRITMVFPTVMRNFYTFLFLKNTHSTAQKTQNNFNHTNIYAENIYVNSSLLNVVLSQNA